MKEMRVDGSSVRELRGCWDDKREARRRRERRGGKEARSKEDRREVMEGEG